MTNGQQQSSQLEYPQIFLDVSLESLLSHSNASTMTTSAPEPQLEPDHHLSESWATLSNSDYSRDDDLRSETTDIGSLVSNNGTEDLHSIEDDLDSEGDEEPVSSSHDDEYSPAADPTLARPLPPDLATASIHEGLSVTENTYLKSIEFEEPTTDSWPEAGQIDVKHTLRIFNDAEAQDILEPIQPSLAATQLMGTVRMSMSRTSLELDRPFRVFYVGDSKARDDILVKIASALLAGLDPSAGYGDIESSRYHVLPQHYGPGAPPGGADLVPIQKTQIVVDEIRSAYYKNDYQSEIGVSLKNGSQYVSRRRGSSYEITSATQYCVPDIALFYISGNDSPSRRHILLCAHKFMLRHHITPMVISDETSWASPFSAVPIKRQSLHMCIESKASETQESRVLRRLPIDFATFEKLDAKQLNKNLACLIEPALSNAAAAVIPRTLSLAKHESRPSVSGDVEKNLSKSTIVGGMPWYGYSAPFRQIMTVALAFIVCGLCYTACRAGILMASSYLAGHGELVAPSAVLSPATSSIVQPKSAVTLTPTPVALTSTHVATADISLPKSLATVAPGGLGDVLSHPNNEMLVNKSDRFQVQVIGDCHMIIKAPAKLKVKRRDPSFKVSVTRGNERLDNLSLSKLFDGVYTVQIDREDAYGLLNVTITMAKAGINEVHEVDFGTPWLKAAGWKKAAFRAQEDIGSAQEIASVLAQRLTENVETKIQALWNLTNNLGRLYSDAARHTEAISNSAQTIARVAVERVRVMSKELRSTSTTPHTVASQAFTENIERVQKTLARSSSAIVKYADHIREVGLRSIAKAQSRAKQIAKETKQRKALRKAARVAGGSRCGRKGKKCNR
jgi:hypothetical protein